MSDAQLMQLIEAVTLAVELTGIGVIIFGALVSAALFALALRRGKPGQAYSGLRSNLGRSILLGLELLVAADIINTVAIEPTLDSVIVLGLIVLIRTFLSFSLEVEIEGRWPWQRKAGAAGRPG